MNDNEKKKLKKIKAVEESEEEEEEGEDTVIHSTTYLCCSITICGNSSTFGALIRRVRRKCICPLFAYR